MNIICKNLNVYDLYKFLLTVFTAHYYYIILLYFIIHLFISLWDDNKSLKYFCRDLHSYYRFNFNLWFYCIIMCREYCLFITIASTFIPKIRNVWMNRHLVWRRLLCLLYIKSKYSYLYIISIYLQIIS